LADLDSQRARARRLRVGANFQSATDAANNAYVEGISAKDWVDDTLMRMRGKDLGDAQ
jgi:hypothetical protein